MRDLSTEGAARVSAQCLDAHSVAHSVAQCFVALWLHHRSHLLCVFACVCVLQFLDDLTNRVFDLVNSADVHEKLGGIAVIDELIEVKSEVNETMIIRVSEPQRLIAALHDAAPSGD